MNDAIVKLPRVPTGPAFEPIAPKYAVVTVVVPYLIAAFDIDSKKFSPSDYFVMVVGLHLTQILSSPRERIEFQFEHSENLKFLVRVQYK